MILTEGNARKSTVNIAFFGLADVIKYQEKPTFLCERAQITEARITSARAVIKLYGATLTSAKADLHSTNLSHAICLRQVYDTNRFV